VKSNVDRAGNFPHPRLDLARDRVIRFLGVAGDPDIDRRGQTKPLSFKKIWLRTS